MSNPKDTSDWLETQVKKIVREELASGCPCNNKNTRKVELIDHNDRSLGIAEVEASCQLVSVNMYSNRDLSPVIYVELCRPDNTPERRLVFCQCTLEFIGLGRGYCEFDAVDIKNSVITNHDLRFIQNSSPVVAESWAVTPDAPAMTVQENTGAGAVSPSVPAQPRFVAVGGYVYDRELDRTFATRDSSLIPVLLIERLNAGHVDVNTLLWEDAK